MSVPEIVQMDVRPSRKDDPVFLARLPDYHVGAVEEAVADLLDATFSEGNPIQAGMTVLLKPNMLSDRSPEEAIDTHPAVVEAVTRYVQRRGAKVLIGDSPPQLHGSIRRFWRASGFEEVARRTGAELVSFETGGIVEARRNGFVFHLARWIEKADLVINLPKLKTHNLTLLTAGVKNMFGCVPGGEKGDWHRRAPHPDDFSQVLVEIYQAARPAVSLVDGIVGMVGNGPAKGERAQLGLLLASRNGFNVDVVSAAALGLDPSEVPTNRIGSELGICQSTPDSVEIVGVGSEVPDFPLGRYALPSNRVLRSLPRPLLSFLGKRVWIHPGVDVDKCTGCGICADNCPANAITMQDHPRFDYNVCIDCWCCAESCPEGAIVLRKSLLAKIFA